MGSFADHALSNISCHWLVLCPSGKPMSKTASAVLTESSNWMSKPCAHLMASSGRLSTGKKRRSIIVPVKISCHNASPLVIITSNKESANPILDMRAALDALRFPELDSTARREPELARLVRHSIAPV